MSNKDQSVNSRWKFLDIPIHPLLFNLYPILFVYTRNIQHFSIRDIIRYLCISTVIYILLLLGFGFILRNWYKGGVLSTVTAFLFYTYGHLYNAVTDWIQPSGSKSPHHILGFIWIATFLILSYIIVRGKLPKGTTRFLNSLGLFLVVFSLISIYTKKDVKKDLTHQEKQTIAQLRGEAKAEANINFIPATDLPDIYYIVFDGYVRSDYLKHLYGYNNEPFLSELKKRGFYICSESHSNYLNTNYSLNSSINLTYFHEFPKRIFNKSKYNLYTNYVNEFLGEYGYKTVVFDSGTGDTNNQDFDIFISPQSTYRNPTKMQPERKSNTFERFFLRTTMMRLLIIEPSLISENGDAENWIRSTTNHDLEQRRNRIRHALTHLPDFANQDGHYFLFAHIFLPHYPFLYGPEGKELTYQDYKHLYWPEEEFKNYKEYYTYQIDYLNKAILDPIDRILEQSTKPVVIILQSDHGNHKYLDWEAPTPLGVKVRSANLCAIFYSDRAYDSLYPSITPVNEFRLVLNHWFGTEYPILQDRVYFHEHPLQTGVTEKPDFIESCTHFNICLPSPHSSKPEERQ